MIPPVIAYISTEPITPPLATRHSKQQLNYRCTIELIDGSTIIRCGVTIEHALANAIACYKTTPWHSHK